MIYLTGSLNMDMVIESPYMPQEGETVTGGGFITNGGGKGANQAVACAKLGGAVSMCGSVGDDLFGKTLIENLKDVGVGTSNIGVVNGIPTGIAVIIVTNRNNRIILDEGANACLTKESIDRFLKGARPSDIYLTQLENPVDMIGYGLQKAKEIGLFTILNPAPANIEILNYSKYIDLIVPNETELELLGGKGKLFERGIKKIVTTLGNRGYEIASSQSSTVYPCINVEVVDTTAAGDTLCGGLAVGLSENMTLEDACAFGSKAASLACTKKGAQQSIPTRYEIYAKKGIE